jgi:hypothetical protein
MPKTNPTQVLISLANAMGVDVPSFGEAYGDLTAERPHRLSRSAARNRPSG